jgi:hypothetical protein
VRRNWYFKALAGIIGVWLAICLAEPAQLHTCVMHGGLAIQSHSTAGHQAGHAHGVGSHALSGQSQQQSNDSQSKQCSCLGDCNNAGKVFVALVVPAASFASVSTERDPALFSYVSPSVATDRLLPFSNGPPSSSSRA